MNLKDKELKSIVTTNIDFDSEEIFGIKGQNVYKKEDVKEAVLEFEDRVKNYPHELIEIDTILEDITDIFGDFEK